MLINSINLSTNGVGKKLLEINVEVNIMWWYPTRATRRRVYPKSVLLSKPVVLYTDTQRLTNQLRSCLGISEAKPS